MSDPEVGTAHLWYGLARAPHGSAAALLSNIGATADIISLLHHRLRG